MKIKQDRQDIYDMKYESITEQILGCAFEVINELGSGFLESVYEKALMIVLKEKGFSVVNQYPINVYFRNKIVGEFYADLLVDNKVIVELKAVKSLLPEHKAQVINYLKGTGIEVGLLINFGNQKLEFNRLYLPRDTNPVNKIEEEHRTG
ncbi:MAG: GxxExxY protein [Spirochaetota bacterium]